VSLDHEKLLSEIDAEVKRRRESGDIPADLERELDLVFARFAPVDALEADFEQVLTRAEQATFIDTIAPVESSRPVVPYFKLVVRKIVGWYMRYVAQQTTGFAHAITRATRLLGERVDVLEQASPGAAPPMPSTTDDMAYWAPVVADRLAGVKGRVLHGEAGDGALLAVLAAAGIDAYGVDTVPRAGLTHEVREDDVVVHLKAVPDDALGAVVLSGGVDRMPLGAQLRLADLAAAKAPVVVVIGRDPAAWARSHAPVEVDLSPGRPLHAETWRHLLAERGLVDTEVIAGPAPEGLQSVPNGDKVLNENIERLNAALFGPSTYAVVARRPA
jgi:hypothetical protein